MGAGCSTNRKTVFEFNYIRLMECFNTKYKTGGSPSNRELARSDDTARQNILLFPHIHGEPGHANYIELFEQAPEKPFKVFQAPRNILEYQKMMLYCACIRNNKTLLDIAVIKPVSKEFLVSLLGAMELVDVTISLNLTRQEFDARVVHALLTMLTENKYLEYITLNSCGLTASASRQVAHALKRLMDNRKATISLLNNKAPRRSSDFVQHDSIPTLPPYYTVCPSLRYLDVSCNQLNDDGLIPILETLQYCKDLEYLSLAATGCRDGGIAVLCECLSRLTNLAYIDLSENPGITSDSTKTLVYALKTNHILKQLNLRSCNMSAKGQLLLTHYLTRNQTVSEALEDLIDAALAFVNDPRDADTVTDKACTSTAELVVYQENPQASLLLKTQQQENILKRLQNTKASMQDLILNELCQVLAEHACTKSSAQDSDPLEATLHGFSISQSETIGRRTEMEDVTMVIRDFGSYRRARPSYKGKKYHETKHKEILLGIFDGHGGSECSSMVGDLFPIAFADTLNSILYASEQGNACNLPDGIWEPLFVGVFLRLDDTLRLKHVQSGSTAAVCFILDNVVITANCGDSRVVLTRDEALIKSLGYDPTMYKIDGPRRDSRINEISSNLPPQMGKSQKPPSSQLSGHAIINSARYFSNVDDTTDEGFAINNKKRRRKIDDIALRLSKDHKPDNPTEMRRIEAVGGYVHAGRVMSTLSVCRAFGDFVYKPSISVVPFVSVYHFQKYDAWIVLACDGCWDSLSDIDAAMLLSTCLSAQAGALKLRDEAYRLDSQDNISVITVRMFLE